MVASAAPDQHAPRTSVVLSLILLWVAAIQATGIFGVFVFDDHTLLVNTALQHGWDFEWFQITGRPVTMATFAANFTLFGPTPLSCHVVNIAIHLAAVSCLFALVRRSLLLLKPSMESSLALAIAATIALLWGVHPLCTSAVTYIVQRAESLASLGILLSLLAWSKAFGNEECGEPARSPEVSGTRSWFWGLVAVASACLAYGSKEISAGLPLIILLYDRVFLAASWRTIFRRAAWYITLVLPLVVGAAMIIPNVLGESDGKSTVGFNIEGFSSWSYFTSQPRVFVEYLRLSLLPLWLSLDYGWLPLREPRLQWLGLSGWLALAGLVVLLFRRSRSLGFLVVAALVILAPTSTLMPLQDIIFEHRFYLPLACLLSGLVAWIGTRRHVRASGFRWLLAACAVAVALSFLTISRNIDYTSQARMHEVDARYHPDNPRAWFGLAITANFHRPEPKIDLIRKALALSRQREFFYAGTDYNWPRELADTLFESGNVSLSRRYYELLIPRSKNEEQLTHVLFQLAMIASIEGRIEDAEALFQQSLAGDPKIRQQVEIVYAAHRERVGQESAAAATE